MVVVGLAVLAAAPAVATDVHIGINIGTPPVAVAPPPPPPPVVLAAPPPLEVVPRSPVYYAPSVPYSFFYYDGLYYVYHDSNWFFSLSSNGPWSYLAVGWVPRPVLAVPVRYYRVPPGHAKWHGPPPWAGDGHGHDHGHHDHHDHD